MYLLHLDQLKVESFNLSCPQIRWSKLASRLANSTRHDRCSRSRRHRFVSRILLPSSSIAPLHSALLRPSPVAKLRCSFCARINRCKNGQPRFNYNSLLDHSEWRMEEAAAFCPGTKSFQVTSDVRNAVMTTRRTLGIRTGSIVVHFCVKTVLFRRRINSICNYICGVFLGHAVTIENM